MEADKQEVIDFVVINEKNASSTGAFYHIFVTQTRLEGYCRMLVIDTRQMDAEYFKLRFGEEGIVDYQHFANLSKEEILKFLQQEAYTEMTYSQGIALLRDALLQNYRYDNHIEWLQGLESPHLAKARQRAANRPRMDFYDGNLSQTAIAKYYLEACAGSDAGLLYDLSSKSQQRMYVNREQYCQLWGHELQGCKILRLHWHEQDNPAQLTGKMLLLSPLSKFLETQVYFDFVWENNAWRVEQADVNVLGTLADGSEMNPLDDRLFVAIVEGAVAVIRQALALLPNVVITGESERQIHYEWFKPIAGDDIYVDLSDMYLAQIIVQREQVVLYARELSDLNAILDKLLSLVDQPLMIKAKGTDTLEHIYRTIKLQQQDYPVPEDSTAYYFSGKEVRQIVDHCIAHFPEKWSRDGKKWSLICALPDERYIEIQAYATLLIVHLYHMAAEQLLQETEMRLHWLAQICLEKGQETIACIRSAQICRPILGDIHDAEKRWHLECEQVRNKKVTYL